MLPLRILVIMGCALSVAARAPGADVPVDVPADEPPLEEVVVTGEFPGPGMWKVRPADGSGHMLWIVGEPPPLPRRMKWKSQDVEAVASRAQEILLDAGVHMNPDEKIGVFRGLSLLPAALKARKNPDEATLDQVLPPDLYARWQVQKKQYLGRDRGIEEWRPIFAADKLRREALDDLGLRESGLVWDVIGKLAKKQKIRTTTPALRFTFRADDIKAKLKEFSREKLADSECLAVTLDYVEALADDALQAQRARAWATADLATLESLPPLPVPLVPCAVAVMSSQVAREILPGDVGEQLYSLWVDSAVKSLQDNETTLAIVPLAKLLREDGYLARLRSRGYEIEAPR